MHKIHFKRNILKIENDTFLGMLHTNKNTSIETQKSLYSHEAAAEIKNGNGRSLFSMLAYPTKENFQGRLSYSDTKSPRLRVGLYV